MYFRQATHSEGATITYSMKEGSMQADSSLQAVQDTAFVLHPNTGVLSLNIQPTASMHGVFNFQVLATDPSTYDPTFFFNSTIEQQKKLISDSSKFSINDKVVLSYTELLVVFSTYIIIQLSFSS